MRFLERWYQRYISIFRPNSEFQFGITLIQSLSNLRLLTFEVETSPIAGGKVPKVSQFSSVQLLSHVQLCDPMNRSTPGLPVHHQLPGLLKLMSIESVMPSKHLILCCPPLLLPLIPSRIRVFSNESTLLMRWQKYWSFSFSISASNEHPGLISFRMDWLDLLAVQGTLKSLL